jgi:hypothetical protein
VAVVSLVLMAVLDEAAGVAAVGPHQRQPVVRGGDLSEQDLGGGAVADVRGGDRHGEQQAEGVEQGVLFAAVGQLAAVEVAAVGSDDGVGLDRLGVDHFAESPEPDLAALGLDQPVRLLRLVAPTGRGASSPGP